MGLALGVRVVPPWKQGMLVGGESGHCVYTNAYLPSRALGLKLGLYGRALGSGHIPSHIACVL